jgi:hypothetical protein
MAEKSSGGRPIIEESSVGPGVHENIGYSVVETKDMTDMNGGRRDADGMINGMKLKLVKVESRWLERRFLLRHSVLSALWTRDMATGSARDLTVNPTVVPSGGLITL